MAGMEERPLPTDNRRITALAYIAIAFALGVVPSDALGQVQLGAIAGGFLGAAIGIYVRQQLLCAAIGMCAGAGLAFFAILHGPGFEP
jgi:hypothetical protein